jgi:hypothetical protein
MVTEVLYHDRAMRNKVLPIRPHLPFSEAFTGRDGWNQNTLLGVIDNRFSFSCKCLRPTKPSNATMISVTPWISALSFLNLREEGYHLSIAENQLISQSIE